MSRSSDIDEVTDRLTLLLDRRKQLCPFPLDEVNFYRSLLPAMKVPEPVTPGDKTRAANWRKILSAKSDLYHVNILSSGLHQVRVFHVITDAEVPTPPSGAHFHLPEDHPSYDEINKWWQRAIVIDNEHAEAIRAVLDVHRRCGTMAQFHLTWPELTNVLKMQRPTHGYSSPAVRRTARANRSAFIADQLVERIHAMLAEAIMLPDKPCTAWIHHNVTR